MEDPKLINEALKTHYGLVGKTNPRFRVVWSEDLHEKRHGIHRKYLGPIYLGEHFGTELCKKYSYISEKWILEVYTPEALNNPEADTDGYEPVWVFADENNHYLPPNMEVCEFIIAAWDFAKSGGTKKNDRILESEEKEAFDKDVKETEEQLQGTLSTPLMSKFHDKEAVIIHKKEEKES